MRARAIILIIIIIIIVVVFVVFAVICAHHASITTCAQKTRTCCLHRTPINGNADDSCLRTRCTPALLHTVCKKVQANYQHTKTDQTIHRCDQHLSDLKNADTCFVLASSQVFAIHPKHIDVSSLYQHDAHCIPESRPTICCNSSQFALTHFPSEIVYIMVCLVNGI